MPVLHCPTIFRHTHTKYLGLGFRSGLLICRLLLLTFRRCFSLGLGFRSGLLFCRLLLRHLCSSSGLLLCRLLLCIHMYS